MTQLDMEPMRFSVITQAAKLREKNEVRSDEICLRYRLERQRAAGVREMFQPAFQ